MFSFPTMQVPYDVNSLINSELRLYNAVTANAFDVTLRIADLNLYALKQAMESWTAKTEKLANADHTDQKSMPAWLDIGHLKNDIENATAYGQQMTKIMLDLQGEFAKIAQQRAAGLLQKNTAATGGGTGVQNGGESAMAFIRTMVDQASKGYTQWTANALHAMESMDADLAHAGGAKEAAPAKPRSRK
ncbi:phasin family protein [Herbaspirillum sp. RV1423]|uniref:phasin family protein n=1 Tax=Herbaspirillum sp. RV1423 TaxID=1443993 RepID=UPI0004B77967|nr:phasin family protein [Herbaspirillum sp. RV1423]